MLTGGLPCRAKIGTIVLQVQECRHRFVPIQARSLALQPGCKDVRVPDAQGLGSPGDGGKALFGVGTGRRVPTVAPAVEGQQRFGRQRPQFCGGDSDHGVRRLPVEAAGEDR